MHIAVFGLGYVGAVTAACLARLGHHVVGVDRDASKVAAMHARRAPFYEPGLQDMIEEESSHERLRVTTSAGDALDRAEIALVCVGTPSANNGSVNLEQLRRVTDEIARTVALRGRPLTIAVRSTVFPGTCEDLLARSTAAGTPIHIVSNPEFLREGSAIRDFMEPGLLVIGGSDADSVQRVARLYESLPIEPRLVSLRTAEMIKYASNTFHAVKIAFANEVGALCDTIGVDGLDVMDTLCADRKLNISPAYLKPGFAFGGSCLPKDLRALLYSARMNDLRLPLMESALPSNDEHLRRAVRYLLDRPESKIGVVGLAFKENTDDVRESAVVAMLEVLIGKGRQVRVYDPQIRIDAIYGTNRSFVLNAIPHIGRLMQPTLDALLDWAELVVVAQRTSRELMQTIRARGVTTIDVAEVLMTPSNVQSIVQSNMRSVGSSRA